MSDVTGFISGDELLASLGPTPQEASEAIEWVRSNFGSDSKGG